MDHKSSWQWDWWKKNFCEKLPEKLIKFFSGLKFYSIWVSQTTKYYSIFASPTTRLYSVLVFPKNQILLHLGVPDNCSSGPGMARRIYSLSSCRGHRNGVKFGCRGHRNGVKFGCRGHWNGVKFGCRGHPNGVKFQS